MKRRKEVVILRCILFIRFHNEKSRADGVTSLSVGTAKDFQLRLLLKTQAQVSSEERLLDWWTNKEPSTLSQFPNNHSLLSNHNCRNCEMS